MSVEILRPDARISAVGIWTRTGGTSLVDVLTDGSDATYARSTIKLQMCKFSCTDPGPVTGKLVAICPWARAKKEGNMRAEVAVLGLFGKGANNYVPTGVSMKIPHSDDIADFEVAASNGLHSFKLLGKHHEGDGRYTGYGLDKYYEGDASYAGFGLVDSSPSATRAFVYEAGLKAYYLEPATLDPPSSPSGTVSDSQTPLCEVDVSCIVESWQVPADMPTWLCDGSVEMRIYVAADVPPASDAPPPLVAPVWQEIVRFTEVTYTDGETPSVQTVSATPDVPLANGDYVIFARVSRDLTSGPERYWSDWAQADFAVDIDLPNTPTLSAAANDAAQRVALALTAFTTDDYEDDSYRADVERSDDGGLSWTPVRGCQGVPVAVGANTLPSDYEAPRGRTVTYRARVSAELSADGTRIWSEWDDVQVATYARRSWNIKAPEDPARSWLAASVRVEPTAERDQTVAVFHPFDRLGAVVLGAPVSGETGTLAIYCHNAGEIAHLRTLIAWEGALYIETPWGEERYIHITEAQWVLGGLADDPWRTATLNYVEVGRPVS